MTAIKSETLILAEVVRVVFLDFTLDTPQEPRYRYKIEIIRNQQGKFGINLWSLECYNLFPKELEHLSEKDCQSCEYFYVLNDYWLDTENIWEDTAQATLDTVLHRIETAFGFSLKSKVYQE